LEVAKKNKKNKKNKKVEKTNCKTAKRPLKTTDQTRTLSSKHRKARKG
jgi:hypothetical protein